ncbi:MAG: HAMP domain-containing histidine kinase, partial [Candidatus Sumerlaeaceae bacterium]|nr:HAMP domain-containing histidine kinase [Candidatus Sumerlaeaceae bacterium]
FNLPDTLRNYTHDAYYGAPGGREGALKSLRKEVAALLSGPTSIYRVTLTGPNGNLVFDEEQPGKFRAMNTWQNNLFTRDFSNKTTLRVSGEADPETRLRTRCQLTAYYTTPPGYPAITELTIRYRWYSLVVVLVWCAIYYFVYKYLLRPMQVVTAHLEDSKRGATRLIPRATSFLETSYNNIASQALLQQLQDRLGNLVGQDDPGKRATTIADAMTFCSEAFGFESFAITELSGEDGPLTIVEQYSPGGAPVPQTAETLGTAQHLAEKLKNGYGEQVFAARGTTQFDFLASLPDSWALMTGRLDRQMPELRYRMECGERVCETFRRGFLTFRAYQQNILRQRSEANIVLSRNLGHDLTNIIATTKLDLMGVRQMMNLPRAELDGPRAELLQQAVEGLLQSTRFLQEIVNLYRSFSYVKRPQFERHDLNILVGEFLASFEPSVSARIEIVRDFQPGIPTLIVEPRLLKLALFNVLTNSLDALKRNPVSQGATPKITVRTRHELGTEEFRIEVQDNGPGICSPDGRPLGRAEIDSIFQYGYSTKTEASEGLGLNWVKTIVHDFHQGSVHAANIPGGGAMITMTVKSMETAEARIG